MAHSFLSGVVILALISCSLQLVHANVRFRSNRFKNFESTAHSPGIGHGEENPSKLENDAGLNRFKNFESKAHSPGIGHGEENPSILENDDAGLNRFKTLESTAHSPGIGHGEEDPSILENDVGLNRFSNLDGLENDAGFRSNHFKNLESTAHSPGIGHGRENRPLPHAN